MTHRDPSRAEVADHGTGALPLLEDDLAEPGRIQPGAGLLPLELDGAVPAIAVLCFFQDVIESLAARGEARKVGRLVSEIGPNPLYVVATERAEVLVVHPGVGAPLAAGMLEEVIALGCTGIVACGGAGALRDDLGAAGRPADPRRRPLPAAG